MTQVSSILDRDSFNAFCGHTHVSLKATGSGVLDGLTFGLKDIFDVAGERTGFGSPDWLGTHQPAGENAAVLARLLAAGASMAGRTQTEEMAFSITGENAHYGTPINPAAPERIPGGSSSGSASAVAGGLVDFAIGTDTGGSVRIPASYCGVYGIRPTHGRVSLAGACALAPSFDTCGWFARDAHTLRKVGKVLLDAAATPTVNNGNGQEADEESGSLLYATDGFVRTVPGVDAELMPAVQKVSAVLGALKPISVSKEGLNEWYEVFRVLEFAEIWQEHGDWVREATPQFGSAVAARFDDASRITTEQREWAEKRRASIQQRLISLLADKSVLILPTAPGAAPLRSESPAPGTDIRRQAQALLCIACLGGLPQLTLPLTTVDGCPVGISLIGRAGSDEYLLDVACSVIR